LAGSDRLDLLGEMRRADEPQSFRLMHGAPIRASGNQSVVLHCLISNATTAS
jgi:hypothetical protein